MLLPYVFIVNWTSNNFDEIHVRAFQDVNAAAQFRAIMNQHCVQQVQGRVEVMHEVYELDFRGGDRVTDVIRCDVF